MAGRRPTPKVLKIVRGNPGKRAIRDDEPTGVPGWPESPMKLGRIAAAEWQRLAKLLEGEHRLTLSDSPHLTGAAVAFEKALMVRAKMRGRGLPPEMWLRLSNAERLAWEQYRKCCNDMCLSAGTRPRAKTNGGGGVKPLAPSGSPLDRFLGKVSG